MSLTPGFAPCDPDSQCCLADHDLDCQRFGASVDVLKDVVPLPTSGLWRNLPEDSGKGWRAFYETGCLHWTVG